MPVTGWVPVAVRKKSLKSSCEHCGTQENLGLHHRDQDRTNNSPGNLQTLCSSCHTSEHWRLGKQAWKRLGSCAACGQPARKLGFCETHHSRLRRHGSPFLVKRTDGSGPYWLVDGGPLSGRTFRALPTASLTGWTASEPSATPSSPPAPSTSDDS